MAHDLLDSARAAATLAACVAFALVLKRLIEVLDDGD
jgi:hypothetical protein